MSGRVRREKCGLSECEKGRERNKERGDTLEDFGLPHVQDEPLSP